MHSFDTYFVGVGVALLTDDRLILRASSRTLFFASTMENELPEATVDLHLATVATFCAAALVAGNTMLGLFFVLRRVENE